MRAPGGTRRAVQSVMLTAVMAKRAVSLAAAPATHAAPAAGRVAAGAGVFAWGDNENGQLGDGTTTGRSTPGPVAGLPPGIRQVAIGTFGDFGAALLADGTVSAWGANADGQLGDGSRMNRAVPRQVPGLTGITQITSGSGISSFAPAL